MTATTVDRNTPCLFPERQTRVPLAATTKIPAGAIVARNASGLAVNAANTVGLITVGRAEHTADSNAPISDTDVVTGRGIYAFAPTAALIALGQAACGKRVYIADNQTVGLRNEALCSAGISAGWLEEISDGLYFVNMTEHLEDATAADSAVSPAYATMATTFKIPVLLPNAATTDYDYVMPDKVEIIDATVIKDVAGAGNSLTIKTGAGVAISDAIAAAVDKAVTRAGTLDKATRVIAAGAVMRLTNTLAAGSTALAAFIEVIKRP